MKQDLFLLSNLKYEERCNPDNIANEIRSEQALLNMNVHKIAKDRDDRLERRVTTTK